MRIDIVERATTKLSHIKGLRFEGLMVRCGVPNLNKRVYSKAVIERAVAAVQPTIREGRLYGALEHPKDTISTPLNQLSHKILKTYWKNDNELWAVAEVVSKTIGGESLKRILELGIECGFSTRGLGEVHLNPETGLSEVTKYELMTLDVVSDPSNNAQVHQILESARERLNKPSVVEALVNQVEAEYAERQTFLDKAIEDTLTRMGDEVAKAGDCEAIPDELLERLSLDIMKSALWENRGRKEVLDRTLNTAEENIRKLAIKAINENQLIPAKTQLRRLDRLSKRSK